MKNKIQTIIAVLRNEIKNNNISGPEIYITLFNTFFILFICFEDLLLNRFDNKYLIIILDISLGLNLLIIIIKSSNFNKTQRILKRISKRILIICLIVIVLLFTMSYLQDPKVTWNTFETHTWLEIASGLLIYLLVDFKIKEYGEMPLEDGQRNYEEILLAIRKSKRTVRILDNDFSTFFEVKSDKALSNEAKERLELKNKENLHDCLLECLQGLDNNQKIQILLLHPNTSAAKQRHDDLNLEGFDLFDNMNKGFQFLKEFKHFMDTHTENKMKALSLKLEIKLFKTSFSIVFVSWDDHINFSVLPPKEYTDKKTFKTLQYTPLAQYFNDNFDDIWNAVGKSVDLNDYKKLKINLKASDLCFTDIHWGHDNYNHDLPIFFCVNDKYDFDEAMKTEILNNLPVEIHHDGEIKRAFVYPVSDEKSKNFDEKKKNKFVTLYEHAIKQIENKSGKPKNYEITHIYEIKYIHRHRIMLLEEDYVSKHLSARGYCYTPHNMYNVFLGTHLSKMLVTLYDFFLEPNFNRHIKNDVPFNESKEGTYKRIFAGYNCNIINGNIEINLDQDFYDKNNAALNCLFFMRKDSISKPEDPMDIFLHKTIEADIVRILGPTYNLAERAISYKIVILLIQEKVSENKPLDDDKFTDEWTELENKATYTVLHSAGKKYIKGGMPKVYYNKTDFKEPERIYNLLTTLDSLYVINKFSNKSVSIDSSNTSFDKEEYDRKQKHNEDACGYRNIIVVEFHEQKK